jgi:hypothetical protein
MTDELTDLKSMIEFASGRAERLFRQQGVIHPMYHAIKSSGQSMIIPALNPNKDASVAMTKVLFALEDIDRYVFLDEAWIVDDRRGQIGIDIEKANREGISRHPDRREIVMFMAENRRGEMMMASRFILRPERGKASLAPLKITDTTEGKSEGRMVGLLNWEKR